MANQGHCHFRWIEVISGNAIIRPFHNVLVVVSQFDQPVSQPSSSGHEPLKVKTILEFSDKGNRFQSLGLLVAQEESLLCRL